MDPHIKKKVQQLCRLIEEETRGWDDETKAAALYSSMRECGRDERTVIIATLQKTLHLPAQPPCPCEECEAYRSKRAPKVIQA